MRFIHAALLLAICTTPSLANSRNLIGRGTNLATAKDTLHKHGFEMDAAKHGLAMVTNDKRNELTFCALDQNLTLVIEYRRKTKEIQSLAVRVISEYAPKAKRNDVTLNVLEIGFEKGGVYTLKL
jgi:hypothetical protein